MKLNLNDEQIVYLHKLLKSIATSYPKDIILSEINKVLDFSIDLELKQRLRTKNKHNISKDLLIARLPELVAEIDKKNKSKLPDLL